MKSIYFNTGVHVHNKMSEWADKLKEETGAETIEYSFLTGVIAVGVIAAASVIFEPMKEMFTDLVDKLKNILLS